MEYDLLIQRIMRARGLSPDAARLFAAVARHETGNYTSPVFKKYNNFFGMKDATRRPTTNRNDQDLSDYAEYRTATDSVFDMVMYLDYSDYPNHFTGARDLVKRMKQKGYFEAPLEEYIAGVERALEKVAYV